MTFNWDDWVIKKRGYQACGPEVMAGMASACGVCYGHRRCKVPCLSCAVCITWKEPWMVVFVFLVAFMS